MGLIQLPNPNPARDGAWKRGKVIRACFRPGLIVLISLTFLVGGCGGPQELSADYLGQRPPGDIPLRFAPDLVSTAHHEHSRVVFSPDGLEMYWAVIPLDPDYQPGAGSPFLPDRQAIWFTRKSSAGWSHPREWPVPEGRAASSPAMGPDGRTVYFKALDPQADPNERPKPHLLFGATKETDQWTHPAVAPDILPNEKGKVSASYCFAENGNLYFDYGGPDETGAWGWSLYVSEFRNGTYDAPQMLPDAINGGEIDWSPWIAPDESYLLWSSHREGDFGSGDLYVSSRQADGSWGLPVNLGDQINSPGQERFPSVSPDGRFLFFARHSDSRTYSDIYWVEAEILYTSRNGNNQEENHDSY